MLAVSVAVSVRPALLVVLCPSGKIPYATHDEARRAVKGQGTHHGSGLAPYACRRCGAVHLTSKSRGALREAQRHHA
jgi:hypothetical protein